LEVTDETDRDAAGDPEDAIFRGIYEMERETIDPGTGGRDFGGM
jgi:hypothetical protein